ncbi:IPO5 [Scenedesmus sp. PABB004]|nr:IPO5 [Scenedesmus sp. PABB004]
MSAADVQAVVGSPANFELLVQQLLSADNAARKQAEAVYEGLKAQPDACLQQLLRCMRQSDKVEARSFCAIMLRKALTQAEPDMWATSSPQMQAAIKAELLRALVEESNRGVVHKVCDTVSELAADCLDKGSWPEVLPQLTELVNSGNPAAMEAGLLIIASLASYSTNHLRPHLAGLHPLLASCLNHASIDVQVAALHACCNFINALDEPREREGFQPQLVPMLAALGRCLSGGDEAAAQDVLELLIEVAESHPKFLRKHLSEAVGALLQIATAAPLEPPTRSLAAECLVTLAEARDKAPGMVRRLPNFVGALFDALMHFLLDVEDEPDWHRGDTDAHEEDGAGELFDGGQEFLDRMAIALGGKALVPAAGARAAPRRTHAAAAAAALRRPRRVLSRRRRRRRRRAGALLPVWLGDADWRKRHAALICLAQIAEGCQKLMEEQVEALVAMCLTGLRDSHAKVRWAACQALGQMCTDLGPELQTRCGAAVLPALLAAMDDFANPRVQAHAAAAVVNFSEGCEAETMGPHLDALIAKLLALLQQGKKIVQEGALTALASVADCSQEQFVRYYDAVMPLLSTILTNASTKEHRLLRAKALECVSLVGMAVGRERFRHDAAGVMQLMAGLAAGPLEPDDPTHSYMLQARAAHAPAAPQRRPRASAPPARVGAALPHAALLPRAPSAAPRAARRRAPHAQAGARLCKALGPEFLPYLPVVMPPLLAAAALEPEMKVADPGGDDLDDDDDVEHIQLGDKVLAIRTSSLEEKATACNMIVCYVDELRDGFFPYVQPVGELMVPLLRFYFHEDVRRAAAAALPHLVRAAADAADKGVPGAGKEFTSRLVGFMWDPLIAALKKEPEPDITAAMLDSLGEVVGLADPGALAAPQVEAAFGAFGSILSAAEARRSQRSKRKAAEDFDDEEEEALAAENEAEEELYDQVGTALGSFLKAFGDAALPYVEGLMPAIAPLLDKARPDEERRIALCVIDDMLEHSAAGRAKYLAQLMPVLLDAAGSDHADLRQCALYGVGVCAAAAPELFKPSAPAALAAVRAAITRPDAKSDEHEMATDNALAALAALLEHHGDVLDGAAMAELLVGGLPLTSDAVEAAKVHEFLVRRLEAQDARVLGPNSAHLPALVSAFVRVLGRGTDLVDGGVGLRMAGLLHSMGPRLPPGVVEGAFAGLKEKQQAAFSTYMAGQELPQAGESPGPRSSHCLAASAGGDTLYVLCGELEPRIPLTDDVYAYSVERGDWSRLRTRGEAPGGRIAATAAVIGDQLVLFGGRTGVELGEGARGDLHVLDLGSLTWSSRRPAGPSPAPRSFHASAVARGQLYVFGGCGADGRLADLWAYDPAADAVFGAAAHGGAGGCAGGCAAACGHAGHVITFAGECAPSDKGHAGAGDFCSMLACLDATSDAPAWHAVEAAGGSGPGPRGWFGCAALRGDLVVHGGLGADNARRGDLWRLALH